MSPPLVIPQSRDTFDTRPNANGVVPSVHYNVPMYQPLQTQQGWGPNNPVVDGLMRIMAGVTGGTVQDIRQNYNPTSLTGALNLGSILVPGRKGGPTREQQVLLDAISKSSRTPYADQNSGYVWNPSDPNVQALSQHLGQPPVRNAADPRSSTRAVSSNPVMSMRKENGAAALGLPGYYEQWLGGRDGGRVQSHPMDSNMTMMDILRYVLNSRASGGNSRN